VKRKSGQRGAEVDGDVDGEAEQRESQLDGDKESIWGKLVNGEGAGIDDVHWSPVDERAGRNNGEKGIRETGSLQAHGGDDSGGTKYLPSSPPRIRRSC
jgi:hypothetical protein